MATWNPDGYQRNEVPLRNCTQSDIVMEDDTSLEDLNEEPSSNTQFYPIDESNQLVSDLTKFKCIDDEHIKVYGNHDS